MGSRVMVGHDGTATRVVAIDAGGHAGKTRLGSQRTGMLLSVEARVVAIDAGGHAGAGVAAIDAGGHTGKMR